MMKIISRIGCKHQIHERISRASFCCCLSACKGSLCGPKQFHKVLKLQAHVINFSVILRMCKMLSHLRIRQLHKFGDCLASEAHCQVFANLKVNQVCLELMNLLDLWVSQFLNKIHMDLTRVRLFKSETIFWKFAKKTHTHTHIPHFKFPNGPSLCSSICR